MAEREEETESTIDQSEKVRWRPEEATTKAMLPWWARDAMKVVTSRELVGRARDGFAFAVNFADNSRIFSAI
ncbi:hypothetical protein RHSIM_Rhsim06G0098700 [Rhododendron simsii]|uniref:Uncharacterized protein n=1 Tax=Rhododendron simsii TaxID=118357 RepID=A0A834LM75_RHOSS|nr:hypothetical protein RHSIM_Rhsim06G0098700 [Rhododendron simsii]